MPEWIFVPRVASFADTSYLTRSSWAWRSRSAVTFWSLFLLILTLSIGTLYWFMHIFMSQEASSTTMFLWHSAEGCLLTVKGNLFSGILLRYWLFILLHCNFFHIMLYYIIDEKDRKTRNSHMHACIATNTQYRARYERIWSCSALEVSFAQCDPVYPKLIIWSTY